MATIEANKRQKEAKLEEMRQSLLRMKRDMDLKGSTRKPAPSTAAARPNPTPGVTIYRPTEPEFDYDTQEEADRALAWRDKVWEDVPNAVFGDDVLDGRRPPKIRFPDRK